MKHLRGVLGFLLAMLMLASVVAAEDETTESKAMSLLTPLSEAMTPDTTTPCCMLHPFLAAPDGNTPESGLVMDANGVLYGTTYNGGTSTLSGGGVVFSLASPAGGGPQIDETILHTFGSQSATDGANPVGGVILGTGGVLYGTTTFGGTQGLGTVYQLTPPASAGGEWTEDVLYNFGVSSVNDGANPYASPLLYKGKLYGTATNGGGTGCGGYGCGIVFEISPPVPPSTAWKETIIYRFAQFHGSFPYSNLIVDKDGNLYGTTSMGGPSDNGTVFELAPPKTAGGKWTETVLHSFGGGDGANPESGLVFDDSGALYGTTFNGGGYDVGLVFQLAPPATAGGKWEETVLHDFSIPAAPPPAHGPCYTCPNNGANPYGGLAISKSKVVYGTTVWGGGYLAGEVFRLNPPTTAGGKWKETVVHSFTGSGLEPPGSDNGDGFNPYGGLILKNGLVYGTVQSGGEFNYGDVFSCCKCIYPGFC
jgi:uncharacterized repeat protein (TIGR03803 family)